MGSYEHSHPSSTFPMYTARIAFAVFAVLAVAAANSDDEWEENSAMLDAVPACDEAKLKDRLTAATAAEKTGDKCTGVSLCHAMQILDQSRQDTTLPADQQSYYSAYKCKAPMVEASKDASQETVKSSTGAMCTANSFGMIATTDTACGRLIVASRKNTATGQTGVSHGKLLDFIANKQGPKIWSKNNLAAMCKVSRRGRSKYALLDCSKLNNKDAEFVPEAANAAPKDPFKTAGVRL